MERMVSTEAKVASDEVNRLSATGMVEPEGLRVTVYVGKLLTQLTLVFPGGLLSSQ